jgi:hypothetical protein
MSITKTVDIPESHRLTIDVPQEVPAGKTLLTFTPASELSEAQDIELINRNAERLNRETMDVLSFQSLDI